MAEYEIYPAIMEACNEMQKEDLQVKRIEFSRKYMEAVVRELPEDYDQKTFGPHLAGIFDADEVEVRDDIDRFKVIGRIPGKKEVRIIHGEEHL